jgi:hypothetical protein
LNYLKGWFIFDLIAVLPINYFFNEGEGGGVNDLARIARLPRLYKMVKIFRIVKQSGKIKKYAAEVLQIGMVVERAISLLFVIFIVTHLFGCLWYFMAKWNNYNPDTWVVQTNYLDKSDISKYIY